MASITDRSDGTRYYGQTVQSIARRVWGRRAEVVFPANPNDRISDDEWIGMVVKATGDGNTKERLASVVLRPNDTK